MLFDKAYFLKKLYFLIVISSIGSGCHNYQYFKFASELPQKDNGSFLYKSDSISINYSFIEEEVFYIEITNKRKDIISIDLGRSSMIFRSRSIPFKRDIQYFEATANSTEWLEIFETSSIRGSISGSQSIKHIPPNSKVSLTYAYPPISYIKRKSLKRYQSTTTTQPYTQENYKFPQSDSLNYFRSYLYLTNNNGERLKVLDHNFWLSELSSTYYGELPLKQNEVKKDKLTVAGEVGYAVVGGAVLTLIIVVAMDSSE